MTETTGKTECFECTLSLARTLVKCASLRIRGGWHLESRLAAREFILLLMAIPRFPLGHFPALCKPLHSTIQTQALLNHASPTGVLDAAETNNRPFRHSFSPVQLGSVTDDRSFPQKSWRLTRPLCSFKNTRSCTLPCSRHSPFLASTRLHCATSDATCVQHAKSSRHTRTK